MIFTEAPLSGVFVIEPELLQDTRGFFARTWCGREFEARGLVTRVAQCSTSFNKKKGTLRGMLSRTPHGQFPEYHTSADNLDFVHPSHLAASFMACLTILDVLENDRTYLSQNPKCEPQLGKRGLYHAIGGLAHSPANEMAMLWLLNLGDGEHSLLDVAERAAVPFDAVRRAADALREHGLLKETP